MGDLDKENWISWYNIPISKYTYNEREGLLFCLWRASDEEYNVQVLYVKKFYA